MIKKLFLGALLSTLLGATGVGLLDAQHSADNDVDAAYEAAAASEVTGTSAVAAAAVSIASIAQVGDDTPPAQGRPEAAGMGPIAQQASVNQVGQTWAASGVIVAVDDLGLMLALTDGSQIYVELGPPAYWQAQGVSLNAGMPIRIEGFFNGEQYHARLVVTASGAQIQLRTETGQPLWSGGAGASGGAGEQAGGGTGQAQVPAEDWIDLEGVITAVTRNGLTLRTSAGETLALNFGRSDFREAQAVTFNVGDAVTARGFWEGAQFQAGQLINNTTGERLLLRDPNGRPLWGGPGRAGNTGSASGQGYPASDAGNATGGGWQGGADTGGVNAAGAGGQGRSTSDAGNAASGNTGTRGRGYRGGR